jgi:hypothetical protein
VLSTAIDTAYRNAHRRKQEEGTMKQMRIAIVAGLALTSLALAGSGFAAPGDRVANPETLFAKGLKWIERNGENRGVLQLNSNGSAIIMWNGRTYYGSWEKVDEYRVKTMWKHGGPPGSVWSVRETGDSASPYVVSRGTP